MPPFRTRKNRSSSRRRRMYGGLPSWLTLGGPSPKTFEELEAEDAERAARSLGVGAMHTRVRAVNPGNLASKIVNANKTYGQTNLGNGKTAVQHYANGALEAQIQANHPTNGRSVGKPKIVRRNAFRGANPATRRRRNRKTRSSTRRRTYGGRWPWNKTPTVNSTVNSRVNFNNKATRAALNRLNGRYVVTHAASNNNVQAFFNGDDQYLSTLNKAATVEGRKRQLRNAQTATKAPAVKPTVNPALLSSLAGFKR